MLLTFGPPPATASDYETGESYTGVKFGLLGAGDVKVEDFEVDHASTFIAGLFFDFPIGDRFHYGLSADYLQMDWTSRRYLYPFAQSESLLDLGVTFKAYLNGENSPLGIRPGLGLGIGVLRKMEQAGIGSSSYLTLKVSMEFVYHTAGDLSFLLDGGMWHAPNGGDNAIDVRIGPLLFVRAGVMF